MGRIGGIEKIFRPISATVMIDRCQYTFALTQRISKLNFNINYVL
jgi:hypothetical protein